MKEFVIFDLEATCIDDKNTYFENEIIEIGAVKLNQDGIIIDTFSVLTKPDDNTILSNFCTTLTTIKQSDLENVPYLKETLIDFYTWSKNCVLISWGGYDMKQITRDVIKQDIENIVNLNDMIDRHINFKKWYQIKNNLKKQCGMKKH